MPTRPPRTTPPLQYLPTYTYTHLQPALDRGKSNVYLVEVAADLLVDGGIAVMRKQGSAQEQAHM